MKTTKTKTAGKTNKSARAGEKPKKAKATTRKKTAAASTKSAPSEEDIRQKAYEIYHQRLARGEGGTDMDDWKKALELLKVK
jgi:hypothetical protein